GTGSAQKNSSKTPRFNIMVVTRTGATASITQTARSLCFEQKSGQIGMNKTCIKRVKKCIAFFRFETPVFAIFSP
ncbi:TPA: hypothetical protein ACNFQ0_004967, partial [Enterobacter kobei]